MSRSVIWHCDRCKELYEQEERPSLLRFLEIRSEDPRNNTYHGAFLKSHDLCWCCMQDFDKAFNAFLASERVDKS